MGYNDPARDEPRAMTFTTTTRHATMTTVASMAMKSTSKTTRVAHRRAATTIAATTRTIAPRVHSRRHGLVASPNVERRRASASADGAESMTRVCALEELPRGDRKLVRALGKSILMFWYRDTVFAIESRSPAEGAYSEGFEKARLTQD